jgi:hypothetical protein
MELDIRWLLYEIQDLECDAFSVEYPNETKTYRDCGHTYIVPLPKTVTLARINRQGVETLSYLLRVDRLAVFSPSNCIQIKRIMVGSFK